MIPKKRINDKIKQAEKEKLSSISINNCGLDKIPDQLFKNKSLINNITEIDLSYNALTNISDKIVKLSQLNSIILSHNKFAVFPEILCSMIKITNIQIDHNYLNHIPESVCLLENLKSFNFSNNNILSIPDKLGHLKYLEKLETTGNPLHPGYLKIIISQLKKGTNLDLTSLDLKIIPTGLHRLKDHLKKLTLTANHLTEIHSDILELSELQVLELRNNQIPIIPNNITKLQKLEILGLADNILNNLPENLNNLELLSFLNLSGNRFTFIPDIVFSIPKLKELFFNKNFPGIEIIPDSITRLTTLSSFHIRGNRINSLDNIDLSNLLELKSLFISDNPLTNNSIDILLKASKNLQDIDISNTNISLEYQRILTGYIRNVSELNLSDLNISSLSNHICLLNNLNVLYLHKNYLSDIPKDIIKLEKLKLLNLSNNNLISIPININEFQYLEELDLSDNKINELSSILSDCKQLKILKLARNEISILPSSLLNLSNSLVEFYLSGNKLKSLNELLLLKNLKILHINNNNITNIPQDIYKLENLFELHLNNNEIEYIPKTIEKCKFLEYLNLQNNQLSEIPLEVLNIKHLQLDGNYLSHALIEILKIHKNTLNNNDDNDNIIINLSDMGLSLIPNEITFLISSNIIEINLSHNLLNDININLSSFLSLLKLKLSYNNLITIPLWISQLEYLEYINLDYNPLINIPISIFKLKNLKELYCRYCQLTNILSDEYNNDFIPLCKNLIILDCSENKISNISNIFIQSLESLESLLLGNNKLKEIPQELYFIESLETIDFHSNNLQKLSNNNIKEDNIKCKLKNVNISNNGLIELPIWLFSKSNLQEFNWGGNCNLPFYYTNLCQKMLNKHEIIDHIDLSFQLLKNVPLEISFLGEQIISLDLCGNNLNEFPNDIAKNCINLKKLVLSRNNINNLKSCVLLQNLIELYANQNQIRFFPIELSDLPKLKKLYLSHNEIIALPDDLHKFKTLTELYITNNEIMVIPFYPLDRIYLNYRFNPLLLLPIGDTNDRIIKDSNIIPDNINSIHYDNNLLLIDPPKPLIPHRKHAHSVVVHRSNSTKRESKKSRSPSEKHKKTFKSKVTKVFGIKGDKYSKDTNELESIISTNARPIPKRSAPQPGTDNISPGSPSRRLFTKSQSAIDTTLTNKVSWSKSPPRKEVTPRSMIASVRSPVLQRRKDRSETNPTQYSPSNDNILKTSPIIPDTSPRISPTSPIRELKIRIFVRKTKPSPAKPIKVDTRISKNELQDIIKVRLGLSDEIKELIVSNDTSTLDWKIENDDDVAGLSINDIITIS